MRNEKADEKNKEEEGVLYKVNCKDCENMYIGETKFRMRKRIEQHKKDVEFRNMSSSAIARHVDEYKHEMDWDKKRKKYCFQGRF